MGGTFWVAKGVIKLKDVESVVMSTERLQDGTQFALMALKMRDGKLWEVGGVSLKNLPKEPYPRKALFSFKLPSDKSWKDAFAKLKPDELTLSLSLSPVSATWKFDKARDTKSSTSS
jgi:hypothetical protein